MRVTFFKDRFAATKIERALPWAKLLDALREPRQYATKDAAPLLKLGTFGDMRTENDSLRCDDNMLVISGIEGDYDGEKVTPEEAISTLERHGIRGAIYTSPSHTEERPRWRVLAPLSVELPKGHRDLLLRRLNGALGGILAGESFTLSQTFYYGRINGHPYRCLATFNDPEEGICINQMDDLDAIAEGPPRASSTQEGETPTDADLRAAVLSGANYHEALRSLSARFAGRGMPLADIVATLEGLMDQSAAVKDDRWKTRRAEIKRLADEAVRKFQRDRTKGGAGDAGTAPIGEQSQGDESGTQGDPDAEGTRAKGAIGAKTRANASSTPGRIAGEPGRILDRVRELLGADSFEPEAYPVAALGPLADACAAIAELGQLAPAMAGQCLLTTAALLVQSRADVRTLAGIKPLSLYALTIADSAEGKSTAEDAALRPIREYQRREGKKYREEVKRLAQESGKGKKGEPAGDGPRKPYLIGADGTIEGIRRDFAEGVPSQGVFTSEAATMLCGYGMNADNRSKTAAAFSQLWDRGGISVSRGIAGRIELDDRRLSVHWQIQPDAARSALHDPGLSTIGFWPRFLVACPAPYPPRKAQDFRPDDDSRIAAYWERCGTLLREPIREDCSGLRVIEATSEALALIKQFFERMEREAKAAGGTLESVKPFALRGTEQVFRIGGTLAAFAGRRSIDTQAARDAMALALYSLETWRGIFGDREEAEAMRAGLALYAWLLKQPGSAAAETPMLKVATPKWLRSKDRRDTALAVLSQAGLVAREGDTWTARIPKGAA